MTDLNFEEMLKNAGIDLEEPQQEEDKQTADEYLREKYNGLFPNWKK